MAKEKILNVPDIGGATDVEVIEVLVKPGDAVDESSSLITLESDKASMEVPATGVGIVKELMVKVGDKLSEGDPILSLESAASDESPVAANPVEIAEEETVSPAAVSTEHASETVSAIEEVLIPDIGGATDVDVIEIMVKEGDSVSFEQPLITLEGDKATMDIPSPFDGVIQSIHLKVGDKVSQGSKILVMEAKKDAPAQQQTQHEAKPAISEQAAAQPAVVKAEPAPLVQSAPADNANLAAGPAVRRIAREFGVDLSQVTGSGRKGRITKEDVQAYVKQRLQQPASGNMAVPAAPEIDFSQFGDIEPKPLNKIKRLTAQNLHRSWITIPHVTQFDEADITSLEAFRKSQQEQASKEGYKLTVLAFVTKILASALKAYPQFNASLSADGEQLIHKKYFNIGIAVDTPNGLVVPVIRGVDQLSIADIARKMAELSLKAREKKLTPADMSGACMTISSLGGIGGTAFTPIINPPEVAILGLSRSQMQPVFNGKEFEPRLMLPMSLSYDHRVIDGAEAARFTRYIAEALADIRRILL